MVKSKVKCVLLIMVFLYYIIWADIWMHFRSRTLVVVSLGFWVQSAGSCEQNISVSVQNIFLQFKIQFSCHYHLLIWSTPTTFFIIVLDLEANLVLPFIVHFFSLFAQIYYVEQTFYSCPKVVEFYFC